jgi:hypothetical protein
MQEKEQMAKITADYGELVVEIEGIDAFWALRSQLEIPLAHVRGVALGDERTGAALGQGDGTRVSGAVGAAGMLQHGDEVFWEVHDVAKSVVIELTDERYRWLVVEAEDPVTVVAHINQAIAERRARVSGTEPSG